MEQSKLEQELMPYAKAFLERDPEAMGIVYEKAINVLAGRARKKGVPEDECEDVASEAILYVLERGVRDWNGQSIMSILNRAADWKAMNFVNRDRMIVQEDLPIVSGEPDMMDEEPETPMTLQQLEEYRMWSGGEPHPIWTSINTVSPEDEVLAENLREKLERIAVEACGPNHWEVYAAVVLREQPQSSVAAEFGISQSRVSQIVSEVVQSLRTGLLGS